MKVKDNKLIFSETEIKGQIKGFLNLFGVWNWHNFQGPLSYLGLPDREGVYKGYHFYIEVKSEKGKLSFDQKKFKANAEAQGEKVFVPHSFEEFEKEWKEWIREIEEEG